MTKRIRINSNKRKTRRKDPVKLKKAPKTISIEEWLQRASTCMTTFDIEAAYHEHQQAQTLLLLSMQHQQPTSLSSSSSTQVDQLVNVLEKMGEIQVSMGDPDQARQHFSQALQLVEQNKLQKDQQSFISWNLLETHASLCLYIGQLSMEQQALEAYLKGVSSLEQSIQLVQMGKDNTIMPSANADTDIMAMAIDDTTLPQNSQQQRQEILQQLQQKLSSAYCNLADLYLTDLCDEETAETDCQHYLEKALQLKDVDGEPMVDALQSMSNLRLSQNQDRRHEAVSYILRAYEKQRVGSEALAALVGLDDRGIQRNTDGGSSSNACKNGSDSAVMPEDPEDHANLDASIGIRNILHRPAEIDPRAVLTGSGKDCVSGVFSSKAKIPTLAAVSPNRVSGPCTSANGRPWYNRGIPPSFHNSLSDDAKLPPLAY